VKRGSNGLVNLIAVLVMKFEQAGSNLARKCKISVQREDRLGPKKSKRGLRVMVVSPSVICSKVLHDLIRRTPH